MKSLKEDKTNSCPAAPWIMQRAMWAVINVSCDKIKFFLKITPICVLFFFKQMYFFENPSLVQINCFELEDFISQLEITHFVLSWNSEWIASTNLWG